MTRERDFRKWLGQYVRQLIFGRSGLNGHFLALHVLPEMMIRLVDMFGPGPYLRQAGKFQSTAIVFEDGTLALARLGREALPMRRGPVPFA